MNHLFLGKDDIIVLEFPPDQHLPTLFPDIETAEERIWGLVILPKRDKWRLEEQETLINRTLLGEKGSILEQLIGVFKPGKLIGFTNLLSYMIEERKDLFERSLARFSAQD